VAWLLLRVIFGVVALWGVVQGWEPLDEMGAPIWPQSRVPRGLYGLVLCSYRLFDAHHYTALAQDRFKGFWQD